MADIFLAKLYALKWPGHDFGGSYIEAYKTFYVTCLYCVFYWLLQMIFGWASKEAFHCTENPRLARSRKQPYELKMFTFDRNTFCILVLMWCPD